jgi:hypothetical protein
VQELLSTVVIRLLNDENIRNQGLEYLMWLLVQPGTKAALVSLLNDTFADPYFQVFSVCFLFLFLFSFSALLPTPTFMYLLPVLALNTGICCLTTALLPTRTFTSVEL